MSRYLKSTLQVFIVFIFIVGAFGTAPIKPVEAVSPDLRISQLYTQGNNTGATYQNDFIELFNASVSPVSLLGKSIQYASATGTGNFGSTASQITVLPDVTIPAYSYYLVKEAGGTTNGVPIENADFIPSTAINFSGTGGKVAIVNSITSLGCNGNLPTTPCDASQLSKIIDLLGYGTANFYEGAVGPAAGPTQSIIRGSGGCSDTDNNSIDFSVSAPAPRNSASPANTCNAPAVSLTTVPTNGAQGVAVDANLILTFSEAVIPIDNWFTLTCTASGVHTATPSTDGAIITLNPDENFVTSETCTLDITGNLLTPQMTTNTQVVFNTITVCGDPYTKISAIQGTGASSPLTAQILATEGVVTADLRSGSRGFYIQDPEPDADLLSSEGLYIYTTNTSYTFNVGDRVRVKGTVKEYNGLTELDSIQSLMSCGVSTATITPAEMSLPFATTEAASPEQFENMVVHFAQPLVINEYYQYDQYGEITLSSKRLDNPTNVVTPGAEAIALQAANDLDKIVLDDGSNVSNPAYLRHPDGQRFCQGTLLSTAPADCPAAHIFRGGDLVSEITAVLDYYSNSSGSTKYWRLEPVGTATFESVNPRPTAPELVPGELRISSINTLNYFMTLQSAGKVCGPTGGQDCRGAVNDEERLRQRAKTTAAVTGMASDVTGLLELENDNPTTTGTLGEDYAIASIVAGLNEVAGSGTYAYIPTGAIGGDAIKAGIVYKTAKVTPIGDYALLTTLTDSEFIDTCNRPVLAQTFQDLATGQMFTLAVNHLKSKSSACAALNDTDTGDGQGNANLTRTKAAAAEVRWLETDPTKTGSNMYLIMGDLNSYAKEDPITAFKNGADGAANTADDYFDLVQRFRELFGYPKSYGYVYSAQAGYLDGALANRLMASYVLDAKEWHINADEVDAIDYTFVTYKKADQKALYQPDVYRSSDHDPILVSLMLNHEPRPQDDAYSTFVNHELTVDTANGVLANDSDDNIYDKIIAVNITQPANGTLSLNLDGSFKYIPNQDFSGVDTFEYTMVATPGLMGAYANSATVTIYVELPFDLYLPIIAK
jgi:predicted extracellular nuclease